MFNRLGGAPDGSPAQQRIKQLVNAALEHPRLSKCLNEFFGGGTILTNENRPYVDARSDLREGAFGETRAENVPATGRATVFIDRSFLTSPLPASDTFWTDTYLHEVANALAIQRFTHTPKNTANGGPIWAHAERGPHKLSKTLSILISGNCLRSVSTGMTEVMVVKNSAMRNFLWYGLVAAASTQFLLAHPPKPPRVEIIVERVERAGVDKVDFRLSVTSRSDRPVFFNGIDYEAMDRLLMGTDPKAPPRPSAPSPYPVYLEQWREKEGWMVVVPCMDMAPPDVIELKLGMSMSFDRALELPLSAVCKMRDFQLEGLFRFRLEYFESEKEARAYMRKLFSPHWKEARAPTAVSETFVIPPPTNQKR